MTVLKTKAILPLLLVFAMAASATAVRITDVRVSKDPVNYQSDFEVTAKLEGGSTCNLLAEYYVDNFRFDYNNIPCDAASVTGKFKLSAEDWEANAAKGTVCGRRNARVELHVLTGNALVANASVPFDIGYVPHVTFEPAQPTENRETRVILTDDRGNTLQSVDVMIRDIYGGDPNSKKTGLDGSFTFTPKVPGEYKMSFQEKDICGETTFYAKRPLIVDGPRPGNPVVNEMVLVGVPSGASVGVKILDEHGNLYKTVPVTYSGGANFSISEPGTYVLLIGDQSTKYWSINKTFTVSDRLVPEIKVAPDQPVVGKTATITISSRGEPLQDATVTVKKPDGVDRDFTTSSYGTVNYDTITSTGVYGIKVTKDRFGVGQASFEAKHAFDAKFDLAVPTVKDTLTLTVKDENDKPVGDVLVEIPDLAFKRVTDMGGKVSFNLQEPRNYDIKLSKDLFWDKTVQFTPYGLLSIGQCVTDFEVGGNILISTFDSFNKPIVADMNFKDPSGVIKFYSASAQTYTPERPGNYSVTVSKTNYQSANLTFRVFPHPLDALASMSAGQLMANVTTKGKPLPNLKVSLAKDGIVFNGTTNDAGLVLFNLNQEGNITVTLNPGRENIMYAEKVLRENVVRSYDIILLTTPLIVIFVITLLTIVAIQLGRMYFGGGGWKLPSFNIGISRPQTRTKHDSVLLGDGNKPKKSRLSNL